MEALPSLPPELVAFAAPTGRGPAPLLASADFDAEATSAALPFDLYLATIMAPPPTGEAWPLTGKALPAATPAAAAAPQAASLPATSAGDAVLLARLSLGSTYAGAQLPANPSPPVPNAGELSQPLPASGTQPAVLLHDAAWQTTIADPAAAMPPDIAELVARSTSDSADAPHTLELAAAPDARTSRPHSAAAEQPLAAASLARSALGATEGPPLEAPPPPREGAAQLEVTKLSQTLLPAVAETAQSGGDWLPAPQAPPGTAPAAAQTAGAGPPVDVRAPNWQEAFASRVQWLAGSNAGEARITLNPPELGAVDVKISLVDDKTYVQLTAATAAARDELSQSLPRLRDLFAASGIELGGASVQDGGGNRAGHDAHRAAMPERRMLAPFAELADEPPASAVARRPLGRVDLFA